MNISSLIGIFAAILVLSSSVLSGTNNTSIFADFRGILIVFGGTTASALICFPPRFYIQVAKALQKKFFGNYIAQCETVIREIVDLCRGVREDPDYLKKKLPSLKTPFLKDAVELLVQGGIPLEALDTILLKRAATYSKRFDHDANVIKTISKFPPAFGLMGTTLGMISLLQNLGGADSQKLLGPAMAVGLVATFYGIVLANLVFIPISENLTMINREDRVIRSIVIDGFRLLNQKEHPRVVEEHLKSYLMPYERDRMKKAKT